MSDRSIIIIPARLQSNRLPNKPLLDIAGLPMIIHVWKRAIESKYGRVVVACAEQEICDIITQFGGEAILTKAELPSGTDRIYQALQKIDPQRKYQTIVNVQGDLPTLDPRLIKIVGDLIDEYTDMATLVSATTNLKEINNPNIVKAIISWNDNDTRKGRALYFTRSVAPHGEGVFYHHIGLYAYRRDILEKFIHMPPSILEKREGLEQLRAIEAGMLLQVVQIDTVPLGVDTEVELQIARRILEQ